MKLDIISKNAEKKGSVDLPQQFQTEVRNDIIQRVVEVEQSENRQPYGASPLAGKRHSAFVAKRRRDYRGTYGIGQSRTPRKVMSRNGTRMNWVGAFAPQTVGGRRSHPPKASKIWVKRVNNKEENFAFRSAMAATLKKEMVAERGHTVPEKYPFIVDSSIDTLAKTSDVIEFLTSIGMEKELIRADSRKVRAGKGKSRGRKYKKKKGPLIVTADDCPLLKSGKNIPGVEVVKVKDLTVQLLAPGAVPGRITLWTEAAIKKIAQEKLYM
jgi:large subunit ribosomal protein L4e